MTTENQLLLQIEEIKAALKSNPDDASLLNELGVGYSILGQYGNAIVQHKKAVSLQPDEPVFHYNLGNAYSENDQPEQAIKAYHDALDKKPEHIPSLNNLADVYEAFGETDKAFELFNYLIRLSPDDALAHFNLGNFYIRQNQHIEAAKCYETALEKDGEFIEAYHNISWILYKAKAYPSAMEYAEKGLKIDASHEDLEELQSKIKKELS